MSTLTINKSKNAVMLFFEEDKIKFLLKDGREIGIPIEWFPRLRNATLEQLKKWRFIGDGEGVHWEVLDEDLLIENLI
jgi:hypothetical protein